MKEKCKHIESGMMTVREHMQIMDNALAEQKAELKKKVLEIISSTCIGDDVAHHFRAHIKKRISEVI